MPSSHKSGYYNQPQSAYKLHPTPCETEVESDVYAAGSCRPPAARHLPSKASSVADYGTGAEYSMGGIGAEFINEEFINEDDNMVVNQDNETDLFLDRAPPPSPTPPSPTPTQENDTAQNYVS